MGLLTYLKPKAKTEAQEPQAVVSEKPSDNSIGNTSTPETSTPGSYTPGQSGTPWGSRPASLYPAGEGRLSQDGFNDIKCDVMVNWLYQQQMERLWTAGGHDEGVVLKKSRHNYACYPPQLRDMQFGLYESAMELNVRVCQAPTLPPLGMLY